MRSNELDHRFELYTSQIRHITLREAESFINTFKNEAFTHEEIWREQLLPEEDDLEVTIGGFCVSTSMTGVFGSDLVSPSERIKLVSSDYWLTSLHKIAKKMHGAIWMPSSASDFYNSMLDDTTQAAFIYSLHDHVGHLSSVVPLYDSLRNERIFGIIDLMRSKRTIYYRDEELIDLYTSAEIIHIKDNSEVLFDNVRSIFILKHHNDKY